MTSYQDIKHDYDVLIFCSFGNFLTVLFIYHLDNVVLVQMVIYIIYKIYNIKRDYL